MKTIERYVFGAFLSSFFLAFLVLSFVLTIGLMVQIVDYMLQGIPVGVVGRFALVTFPETMQWTIPLGLLVASILVFSRLSADSEIAAMRACGINLLTVMRWPLAFAAFCTVFCLFINNEIVPRGHEVRRNLTQRLASGAGLELFKPGVWIEDFPNVSIRFEQRDGNRLCDIKVIDRSDPKVQRRWTVKEAQILSDGRDLVLDLNNMEPVEKNVPGMFSAKCFRFPIKDVLKRPNYKPREKDFRFFEMLAAISQARADVKNPGAAAERKAREKREKEAAEAAQAKVGRGMSLSSLEGLDETEVDDAKEKKTAEKKKPVDFKKSLRRNLSNLLTEFNKRLVFAFASICFVLIGVPLGIRAQRRESTIGMAISLATALCYYLVVILMTNMSKSYAVHPHLLIWLPVVICFVLAGRLIPKNL